MAENKCQDLFKQMDALNNAEDLQYGERDLEELGNKHVSKEAINAEVGKLSEAIEKTSEKRKKRKAESLKKKVIEQ